MLRTLNITMPANNPGWKLAVVWLVLSLAVREVHAHEPFDNGARLILRDDSLKLEVIFGKEAAAKFLKDSPAEILRPTGPSGTRPLPVEAAVRLGTLTAQSCASPNWPQSFYLLQLP
jgi:hypothetical protein